MRPTYVVALLLLSLSACTVRFRVTARLYVRPERFVAVATPCPPLRALDETRPSKTDPTSVWIAGHWDYDEGGWVWLEGAWVKPDPGFVWEPPVCAIADGDNRFYPGYFRRRERTPPPVYREPGHVRMSCPDEDEPEEVPQRIIAQSNVPLPNTTGPSAGVNVQRPGPNVESPNSPAPGAQLGAEGPSRPTPELPESGGGVGPEAGGPARPGPTLPGGGTSNNTPPNAPDTPTAPGNTNVERPTIDVTPDTPGIRAAIECAPALNRVPQGGRVNLRGRGLSRVTEVRIGGTQVGILRRTDTELVVPVGRGGNITLRVPELIQCGSVELIRSAPAVR
ncbi:MAG: hypothetical protein AAF938_10345 [Myxococcota bacterium]